MTDKEIEMLVGQIVDRAIERNRAALDEALCFGLPFKWVSNEDDEMVAAIACSPDDALETTGKK